MNAKQLVEYIPYPEIVWQKYVLHTLVATILAFVISTIFPQTGSILYIAFLSVALIPIAIDASTSTKRFVLHAFTLMLIVSAFTLTVFVFSDPDTTKQTLNQQYTQIRGLGFEERPYAANSIFLAILQNNIAVVAKAYLLSSVFLIGGVFMAAYTASTFGTYLAALFIYKREVILSYGLSAVAYYSVLHIPHTIVEIMGFVLAGIAGYHLSLAIGHESLSEAKTSLIKLALSVAMIILGSILEAYIDPYLASLLYTEEFGFRLPPTIIEVFT